MVLFRVACPPQRQPLDPRSLCLFAHGFTPLLLNFLDVIIAIEIYGYRCWMRDRLVFLMGS